MNDLKVIVKLVIYFIRFCLVAIFAGFGFITLYTKYLKEPPEPANPHLFDYLYSIPIWMPIAWIVIAALVFPKKTFDETVNNK